LILYADPSAREEGEGKGGGEREVLKSQEQEKKEVHSWGQEERFRIPALRNMRRKKRRWRGRDVCAMISC
jgi:hypothetical protein